MAPEYSGPRYVEVRKCLTNLVRYGLTPQTLSEKGTVLMQLKIVQAERELPPESATDDAQEAADLAAVLTVLNHAIDKAHIPSSKNRRVLRNVLPIFGELRGEPLKVRRTVAGERFVDGAHKVGPDTIRTSYEPTALDWLGAILVKLEAESRGEEPPTDELPQLMIAN